MRALLVVTASLAACATACDMRAPFHEPEWSLERMIDQPMLRAFDPTGAFPDGKVMRTPPPGTVPTDRAGMDAVRETGMDGSAYAARVPIPVTRALLERGRARFDVVCATCHGVTGDGRSIVATKMAFRPPPTLHDPRIKAYPPGRLFAIARDGYGLMPSYADMLDVDDRWAVVAYLRALWLSRSAAVADLPAPVRGELMEHVR